MMILKPMIIRFARSMLRRDPTSTSRALGMVIITAVGDVDPGMGVGVYIVRVQFVSSFYWLRQS